MNEIAHIRRPYPRVTRAQARAQYRRAQQAILRGNFTPRGPGTYCGAPITEWDWDRRTAVSKAHAAKAEAECCPDCLRIAREESAKS